MREFNVITEFKNSINANNIEIYIYKMRVIKEWIYNLLLIKLWLKV